MFRNKTYQIEYPIVKLKLYVYYITINLTVKNSIFSSQHTNVIRITITTTESIIYTMYNYYTDLFKTNHSMLCILLPIAPYLKPCNYFFRE